MGALVSGVATGGSESRPEASAVGADGLLAGPPSGLDTGDEGGETIGAIGSVGLDTGDDSTVGADGETLLGSLGAEAGGETIGAIGSVGLDTTGDSTVGLDAGEELLGEATGEESLVGAEGTFALGVEIGAVGTLGDTGAATTGELVSSHAVGFEEGISAGSSTGDTGASVSSQAVGFVDGVSVVTTGALGEATGHIGTAGEFPVGSLAGEPILVGVLFSDGVLAGPLAAVGS